MLDGMALIQLQKNITQTFGAYAEDFLNRIQSIAKIFKVSRVDFACDLYPAVSIKIHEREKRATDGSTAVKIGGANQKVLRQFKSFFQSAKAKRHSSTSCSSMYGFKSSKVSSTGDIEYDTMKMILCMLYE